jgi:hypothetical protein
MLKIEKQKFAKIMPKNKIIKFKKLILRSKTKNRGITEIIIPNKNEEKISPKRTVQRKTGQLTSRSRVLERVSQDMIEGPTAVAVKNVVIPINPGNSSFKGILFPIVKAKNKNRGKISPKIITGPFK